MKLLKYAQQMKANINLDQAKFLIDQHDQPALQLYHSLYFANSNFFNVIMSASQCISYHENELIAGSLFQLNTSFDIYALSNKH